MLVISLIIILLILVFGLYISSYFLLVCVLKLIGEYDDENSQLNLPKVIHEALAYPHKILNRFIGHDVGFGQGKHWYSRNNWCGRYIEHIFLIYWIFNSLACIAIQPIRVFAK